MSFRTYEDGFKDAIDLALSLTERYKDIEKVKQKLKYALSLVDDKRFGKIAQELGAMPRELF